MSRSPESDRNSQKPQTPTYLAVLDANEPKMRWSREKKVIGTFMVSDVERTIEESISIWNYGLRTVFTHDFVDVSKGPKQAERPYTHTYLETLSSMRDQAEQEFGLLSDIQQESYRYYYYLLQGGNKIPPEVNITHYRPYLEQAYLENKFYEPKPSSSSA